jgi:hypothetical protein
VSSAGGMAHLQQRTVSGGACAVGYGIVAPLKGKRNSRPLMHLEHSCTHFGTSAIGYSLLYMRIT